MESCRSYLKLRHKAAADHLIDEGDVAGLKVLIKEGLLPETDRERLLKKALDAGATDCIYALLKGEKNDKESTSEANIPYEDRILTLAGRFFDRSYPALSRVLHLLSVRKEEDRVPYLESDGFFLYINASALKKAFQADSQGLKRDLAHCLLHQILGHSCQAAGIKAMYTPLFDACCDCIVEWTLDERLHFPRRLSEAVAARRQAIYKEVKDKGCMTAALLYDELIEKPGFDPAGLSALFACDSHGLWYENRHSVKEWQGRLKRIRALDGAGDSLKGGSFIGKGGSYTATYTEPEASEFSYKEYLEGFMVNGEEMKLDPENMDPIWYHYSRTHYEGAVFLEPTETSEVKRLEELVIAIDTSGSCSGEVVQQFLSETFSILEKKEHFFKKMRIHILQCDSMIQDHRLIEDEEDWKVCKKDLKIKGFGYTDFQPVFKWIEKQREKGEIRDLKGLIYFTDGAGVFPKEAPDYETAFVFLNDKLKKGELPPWITAINLGLDKEFRTLFDDEREGRIGNGWGK